MVTFVIPIQPSIPEYLIGPCLLRPGLTGFKSGIDILYSVDYYPIINKLTAREKPMDTLETLSEENLREFEAIEESEAN